jgi:dTDP-4-amino-4,6-dideoxygalactose transaminase
VGSVRSKLTWIALPDLFVNRAELRARLQAEEIGFGIHDSTSIHLMTGYAFLGYPQGSLKVTEGLAQRCCPSLAIPNCEARPCGEFARS